MKLGGYLARSKVISKLSDLTPDARNANKGTERGSAMIEESLRKFGAGGSILIDKHGNDYPKRTNFNPPVCLGKSEDWCDNKP